MGLLPTPQQPPAKKQPCFKLHPPPKRVARSLDMSQGMSPFHSRGAKSVWSSRTTSCFLRTPPLLIAWLAPIRHQGDQNLLPSHAVTPHNHTTPPGQLIRTCSWLSNACTGAAVAPTPDARGAADRRVQAQLIRKEGTRRSAAAVEASTGERRQRRNNGEELHAVVLARDAAASG